MPSNRSAKINVKVRIGAEFPLYELAQIAQELNDTYGSLAPTIEAMTLCHDEGENLVLDVVMKES